MDPDRAVARLAESQHGVLTRAQALASGLTRHAIRHRLIVGRWEAAHPGVYRLAGSASTWQQRTMSACLAAGPGAVASHRSAGRLWSLPGLDGTVELTVPKKRRVAVRGVVVHRACQPDSGSTRTIQGIPATSLPRTLVDLAAVLEPDHLELVVDHALSERLVTVGVLRRRLEFLGRRGRKGAGRLLRVLDARDSGAAVSQSLFELRLLRVLAAHGLPVPRRQHPVRLPGGRKAYLDLAYPDAKLAIEADSYRHHSSLTAWARDRVRNNALVSMGWRVLPVTYPDLAARPRVVAEEIARALASGGPVRPRGG